MHGDITADGGIAMHLETSDGTKLFYCDWGTGSPVVFLHGWGLGSGMWEYQMPWLADRGLRCIALDARGCGRSDDPGRGYDFDTLADDVAALVDRLGLERATLVVHGDADQSTPLETTGRPTARGIAGARLVVYEGAAHGLFFTEKDRLNRDLLEFVSS
jgi:pimeloyl-ACP methyl ester carboxylesterase